MAKELTVKQRRILVFIAKTIWEKGYQPSYREIARRFRLGSAAGVVTHLAACEKKGACVRMGSRAVHFTWRNYLG